MSLSNYAENKVADALCGNATFTTPTNVYVKLHIGDPGEDCTANAAGETTRKEITFGAASGGVCTQDNTVQWTNVSTGETYSYVSFWDHLTAGNPLGSGALTASKTVAAGDTFELTGATFTMT